MSGGMWFSASESHALQRENLARERAVAARADALLTPEQRAAARVAALVVAQTAAAAADAAHATLTRLAAISNAKAAAQAAIEAARTPEQVAAQAAYRTAHAAWAANVHQVFDGQYWNFEPIGPPPTAPL